MLSKCEPGLSEGGRSCRTCLTFLVMGDARAEIA